MADLMPSLDGARLRARGLLPHVAARIFNQPLAITPLKLHAILAAIGPRLGLDGVQADVRGVIRQDRSSDYQVIEGVGVVPIMGTVVKRNGGGVLASSGMVSTEALKETILQALADPAVRALVLQVDSYGGEVAGTADLAQFILDARGTKPIWAVVDEAAYSAAYWIASAADRVVMAQNGGVGSIGVLAIHVDESAALEAEGLAVTVITAGDRKADLSPFDALSERGRVTLQTEVNRVWDRFVGAVARQRSIAPKTLYGYQAGIFQGTDGVTARLADAIGTFDDVVLELATRPAQLSRMPKATATQQPTARRTARPEEDHTMPDTPQEAGEGEKAKVISIAEHQQATDAARVAGIADEKARCKAIGDLVLIAARGPLGKEAQVLGNSLIASGATVAEASAKFVDAAAKLADAAGPILGLTPETEALIARAPSIRPREDIMAERTARMLTARTGGRGVLSLHAPAEKGA